jgi:hypothetical protein
MNKGLDKVLSVLEPIFDKYPTLSYADLIVLAGTVSVAHAAEQGAAGDSSSSVSDGEGSKRHLFSFCPKRTDAAVVGPESLDFLVPRSYKSAHIAFRWVVLVKGGGWSELQLC